MLEDISNVGLLLLSIFGFSIILNIYLIVTMLIFDKLLNNLFDKFKEAFVIKVGILFLFGYSIFSVIICYIILYISKYS